MQVEQVVFVSGASRGLGSALAKALATPGTLLLTLSRAELGWSLPEQANLLHQHWQADLSTQQGSEQAVALLTKALSQTATRYVLINNAGTVAPIAPSHKLNDMPALTRAYQLNVLSPMALSAAFLQHAPAQAKRQILNISSGAGRRPVPGWAVYGSTKAALDYYTQVMQLEHPDVQVASLAPGVIDTDMQAHIRQQTPEDFPGLSRFIDMHQHKQLDAAELTANRIVAYLNSPDFGRVTLDDIRHYE